MRHHVPCVAYLYTRLYQISSEWTITDSIYRALKHIDNSNHDISTTLIKAGCSQVCHCFGRGPRRHGRCRVDGSPPRGLIDIQSSAALVFTCHVGLWLVYATFITQRKKY